MEKPFCNLYYEGEAKNSGFPRLLPHMWHRSHNHNHFAKHFTKWLQLHQRSHFTRVATATVVLGTAETLPKGPCSLLGWLVADDWCWFVLREEYCWLVAGGWFVVREKYCWLVADKPSEKDTYFLVSRRGGPLALANCRWEEKWEGREGVILSLKKSKRRGLSI
jgi:hypothetical protein